MTQTSSSSATIAWNRVPGASGYRVSWRSGHGGDQGFWRVVGNKFGWNGGWGLLRGPGGTLGDGVWLALELPPFSLPGPEKSQLVSGEATTVAELDGLEPDTEYTVHVRAHVAGVDGIPASVVVKTREWTLAGCQPHFIGYPARLCVPDCSSCPFHHRSVTSLFTLTPL